MVYGEIDAENAIQSAIENWWEEANKEKIRKFGKEVESDPKVQRRKTFIERNWKNIRYNLDKANAYLKEVWVSNKKILDALYHDRKTIVMAVQIALYEAWYLPVGLIDGQWWPITRGAVKDFQNKNGWGSKNHPGYLNVATLTNLIRVSREKQQVKQKKNTLQQKTVLQKKEAPKKDEKQQQKISTYKWWENVPGWNPPKIEVGEQNPKKDNKRKSEQGNSTVKLDKPNWKELIPQRKPKEIEVDLEDLEKKVAKKESVPQGQKYIDRVQEDLWGTIAQIQKEILKITPFKGYFTENDSDLTIASSTPEYIMICGKSYEYAKSSTDGFWYEVLDGASAVRLWIYEWWMFKEGIKFYSNWEKEIGEFYTMIDTMYDSPSSHDEGDLKNWTKLSSNWTKKYDVISWVKTKDWREVKQKTEIIDWLEISVD